MNFIALSAETSGTLRDENGVPVEWTLLRILPRRRGNTYSQ